MYPRIYKEITPHKHLTQYIKCYWVFENSYPEGGYEHVFPDSSYELIYIHNNTFMVDSEKLPKLFIVGQLQKPVDFAVSGLVNFMAVRFYPWGFVPFGDVHALSNIKWVDAASVIGKKTATQLTGLMSRLDEKNMVKALDDFFLDRLLSWQFKSDIIQSASQKLLAEKGKIKVRELADSCFVSQRHLERTIVKSTGMTPRDIAVRLRFEKVRDAIMHNPDIPLTYLAHEFGYSDQSHFTKDFKKYTDIPPSEYAKIFRKAQPRMQNKENVVFLRGE